MQRFGDASGDTLVKIYFHFELQLSLAEGRSEKFGIADGHEGVLRVFEDSEVDFIHVEALSQTGRMEDLAPQASQRRKRYRPSFSTFVSGRLHIGQIT